METHFHLLFSLFLFLLHVLFLFRSSFSVSYQL